MKSHLKWARRRIVSGALRSLLVLAVLAGCSTSSMRAARADGTLIPAPNRFDFAHDGARGLVYISSNSQILRYHVADQKFLAPIEVGGHALGLDISPDGQTLAVADGQRFADALGPNEPGGRIVLIDLATLAQTNKSYWLGPGESGAYSLAFDFGGNILISPNITSFETDARAPLRRYYAGNNYVGTLGDYGTSTSPELVARRTVITRNSNGTALGFAETGAARLDWGITSGSYIRHFYADYPTPGTFAKRSFGIATNGTN